MAEGTDGVDRHVQLDAPATHDVETREETLARVVAEMPEQASDDVSSDPSTRRGLHRVLGARVRRAAAVAFGIGAIIGLGLYLLPFGPREESRGLGAEGGDWANAAGYALGMGLAAALIVGVITALLTLEREDGRIEREVEETVGVEPVGPARPNRPEEDLPVD